ncbi:hypothetical protein BC834DRAFT_887871 [Gloeopeniophorella convolvens]|nr:hypothetical protein BC834DRAFT_887871 [Gloeopeniophorella convolvens]
MDTVADLLATKWIPPSQFEKDYGIVCRTGPFTREETQGAEEAIERHRLDNNLSEVEIADIILDYDARTSRGFWACIARAVPSRGVKSVYDHVRRAYHPWKKRGKWRISEDETLQKSVEKLGTNWPLVAQEVERPPQDCRDRWQRHLQGTTPGLARSRKPWTRQDEEHLLRVMRDLRQEGRIGTKIRGFWIEVSKRMDGVRTAEQCQVKWTRSLEPMLRERAWEKEDDRVLITTVALFNAASEDDLDWNSMRDAGWAYWTAGTIREKWGLLKSAVEGEGYSHRGA